jgi:TfoX/Sxy family transcriptional regulator of competence genes
MAYDESVAVRVREVLAGRKGVSEKKMFGGLAFLIRGHMCCGVLADTLVLRLGEDGAALALREPGTRPMDFTEKPMKSMVYVNPAGFASDKALRDWVGRALAFVSSLPAK